VTGVRSFTIRIAGKNGIVVEFAGLLLKEGPEAITQRLSMRRVWQPTGI